MSGVGRKYIYYALIKTKMFVANIVHHREGVI